MRYMKMIVATCLVWLMVYTAVAIAVQMVTGQELSPALTENNFRTIGTELCAVAFIKISEHIFKRKKKKKEENISETETEIP